MSRERKFRAWDKKGGWDKKGEMLYGDKDYHYNIGYSIDFAGIVHGNWESPGAGGKGHINCHRRLYDFSLMQFINIQDAKGRDVYDGDIAKDEHGQEFVVEWDYPLLARMQEIWFEIIGNIHENPELVDK